MAPPSPEHIPLVLGPGSSKTWAKVVATPSPQSSPDRKANNLCVATDIGPGPQPLRGMAGFPSQQQSQARNAALPSSRLPNGKLGVLLLQNNPTKKQV